MSRRGNQRGVGSGAGAGVPERQEMARSEFEVMDVVWDLGTATVGEVMEALNRRRDPGLARGTVQVQLRRLKDKGWLWEGRRSGKLVYSPACDRTAASADIASDVTARVFDGSCAELVRCLYQEDKLTPEEIGRLRDLIGQMNSSSKPGSRAAGGAGAAGMV